MSAMGNKSHTATANRVARRYGADYQSADGQFDICIGDLTIEIETTATILDGIDRLRGKSGRVYVALTNKEGVEEAVKLATGTRVGVMDPQGEIVKESEALPS